MGNQSKFITLAIIVAFGIGNAYYTFNPSLKELKDRREGTALAKTLEPQNSKPPPPDFDQQNKSN